VVVVADAELSLRLCDDESQADDAIVSQWREVSADENHQMRERVNETLRPLGFETSLLVIRRANSLALFFVCMSLSAVMSLRDHWRTRRLRNIVQKLFTILSGHTRPRSLGDVCLSRLTWPLTEYERCLNFFQSLQGKQTMYSQIIRIIAEGSWVHRSD